MTITQWILWGLGSFAVGYGLAAFFKSMGRLYEKWGLLIAIFLFPIIIVYLLIGAEAVMKQKSIILSLIFASGFFIRLLKK